MIIQSIPLRDLVASAQPRPLVTQEVDRLAASIKEVGLIQPITVISATVIHGTAQPGWRIVAGHHRVAACRALGWTEIDAMVIEDKGYLQSELIEIDENLCRAELSPAQRTKYTARRKQIREAMKPLERAKIIADLMFVPSSGPGFEKGVDVTNFTAGTIKSRLTDAEAQEESGTSCFTLAKPTTGRGNTQFAAETAAITGESKQNINRTLAVSNVLGDNTLDRVTGTSLDKGVELVALTKMTPENREALIVRAEAGENVTARAEKQAIRAADTSALPAIAKSIKTALRGVLDEFNCMSVKDLSALIKQEKISAAPDDLDSLNEIYEHMDLWANAICQVDVIALLKQRESA